MATEPAPTLHAYIRVSTDEQTLHGASLGVQQQTLRDYAAAHYPDRQFVCWVEPGVSGHVPAAKRPRARAMIGALRPGDVIIITKLDRLFRNALDALAQVEQFIARNITLISLDISVGPATGTAARTQFQAAAIFAEFERGLIRQRIKDGVAARRRANRPASGNPPFGFRIEGKGRAAQLVEDEQEEATRHPICELFQAGYYVAAIEREFAERAIRSRYGGMIRGRLIRKCLEQAGLLSGPIPMSARIEHKRRTRASMNAAGRPWPTPTMVASRKRLAAKVKIEQAERDGAVKRTIRRLRRNGVTGGPTAYATALNKLDTRTPARDVPWSAGTLRPMMYRLGLTTTKADRNAVIDAEIARLYRNGITSPRAIGHALNTKGILTLRRTRWTPDTARWRMQGLNLTVSRAKRSAAVDDTIRRLHGNGITDLGDLRGALRAEGIAIAHNTLWQRMRRLGLIAPSATARSLISTSDSPGSSLPPVQRQLMLGRSGFTISRYSPLLSCSLPSSMRKRTRKRPPTCGSVSATSTGPASGPHQLAMPSGVMSASKTIDGRALIRRTSVRPVIVFSSSLLRLYGSGVTDPLALCDALDTASISYAKWQRAISAIAKEATL
jgi:DNA invertase Pin-like site-specific DNA recombinase